MSRQLIGLLLAAAVLCGTVAPVSVSMAAGTTSSRIIAKKSAKQAGFGVYLKHGLTSGHDYRIEIVSTTKASVSGTGFENYAYIVNHKLSTGMKPFTISGKTPYSYTIQPPVSSRLGEWVVVVSARATTKQRITVRIRDLGTHH